MPLTNCPRCDRMFDQRPGHDVCDNCVPAEDVDMERISQFVSNNPDVSPADVASALTIDYQIVMRAVNAGRVAQVANLEAVRCGRCGAPAISHSKKLCENCLAELNAQLARERNNMNVPSKSSRGGGKGIRDDIKKKRLT